MKRTPLTRRTPLRQRRPGPSAEAKSLGGRTRIARIREINGIPSDLPKNEKGESCVEKTCPICSVVFLVRWPDRNRRKTCSTRCAAESKRRRGGAARKGTKNPNYKHGRRAGHRDREAERAWYASASTECQHPACPGTREVLAQHHVVYEQKVRREAGAIWDPRNSLTLCDSCHSSHHRRGSRVVPLSALSDANYAFAVELLGSAAYDYLRRRYVGDDPRLKAVLTSDYPASS